MLLSSLISISTFDSGITANGSASLPCPVASVSWLSSSCKSGSSRHACLYTAFNTGNATACRLAGARPSPMSKILISARGHSSMWPSLAVRVKWLMLPELARASPSFAFSQTRAAAALVLSSITRSQCPCLSLRPLTVLPMYSGVLLSLPSGSYPCQ